MTLFHRGLEVRISLSLSSWCARPKKKRVDSARLILLHTDHAFPSLWWLGLWSWERESVDHVEDAWLYRSKPSSQSVYMYMNKTTNPISSSQGTSPQQEEMGWVTILTRDIFSTWPRLGENVRQNKMLHYKIIPKSLNLSLSFFFCFFLFFFPWGPFLFSSFYPQFG